jgi:hypothetical protein
MGSTLDNSPLIHHKNLIRMNDGGKSMGNDEGSTIFG